MLDFSPACKWMTRVSKNLLSELDSDQIPKHEKRIVIPALSKLAGIECLRKVVFEKSLSPLRPQ